VVLARVLMVRGGGVVGCLLCVLAFAGVVAARGMAGCSNSGFVGSRGFLAGCGGYERVTPEFKAGARMSPQAFSSDGARVIGASIAVFAGAEGYGLPAEAVYESVRSGTGWVTSSISPSSSEYPAQRFLDFNPDLDRGLWVAHLPSQSLNAEDLYIREPGGTEPGGEFVKVGPIVPPYATEGPAGGSSPLLNETAETVYAGASLDLSHVYFQIRGEGPLWPGDTTAHNNGQLSLYEYVGTGNTTPSLVGVDNEGRLISDCGTSLGSEIPPGNDNADTYNAISADGETVFFTALNAGECGAEHAPEVNEVYARVSRAQTVAISEPSFVDCEACKTTGRAPAEFAGASRDGSKVFFTTSQELLKGATGENLYEYDFHNRPGHKIMRVSAGSATSEVQSVMRVSEDGSHVYFVAGGVLTSGPNGEGGEPVAKQSNLYVFERDATYRSGRLSFVATISEGGGGGGVDERAVQATPDGRFLVFGSQADLTNGDTSSTPQVFEYDAAREELVRVSVGQKGYAAGMKSADTQGAVIGAQTFKEALWVKEQFSSLAVSDDGSVVAFVSLGGLTEAARAAGEAEVESAYEYRSSGGVIANGEVFSVSNGSASFAGRLRGTDHAGNEVLFQTQAPVLASDGDTQEDLYVARDGGGFPVVPLVQDCEMEVLCQGSGGVASVLAGAGSVGVVGGGNLPESTGPPPPPKPALRASRAQRLAQALKVCRRTHRPGRARRVCEAGARRRFGSVKAKGRG
jgi:hypothetical protein